MRKLSAILRTPIFAEAASELGQRSIGKWMVKKGEAAPVLGAGSRVDV